MNAPPSARRALLLTSIGALLAGCAPPLRPGAPLHRSGDEIAVCGMLFHTGSPVVLWSDASGYDAYRAQPRFAAAAAAASSPPALRFGERNVAGRTAAPGSWSLDELREVVRLLVIHYDAAGTSRQCFKILHDVRHLSCHFLIDVDGTIYQTLDLKERAWHAGSANDASIGIEIAHIGAFPTPDDGTLEDWYRTDRNGPRVDFPSWLEETGIRTPGFTARPARRDLVRGTVHGTELYQYDFTEQQYDALTHLVATLTHLFPQIELAVPRDASSGGVRSTVLTPAEQLAFRGLVGHWHLSEEKVDPGPAFDWQRVLDGASRLR